jgi:hypothetical protein
MTCRVATNAYTIAKNTWIVEDLSIIKKKAERGLLGGLELEVSKVN